MNPRNIFRSILPSKLNIWLRERRHQSELQSILDSVEKEFITRQQIQDLSVSPVFVLASPRTGSTFFYQLLVKYTNLAFFSNFTANNFPANPLIGELLAQSLLETGAGTSKPIRNDYGVTAGDYGPSEASTIFANWFAHEHPSQKCSACFLSKEKKENMQRIFCGLTYLTRKELVTKNAWNCFRIDDLHDAFPNARFLWLRRDILSSSVSTWKARSKQGDPKIIWNSASPSNYYELKKRESWEQVVEQQYWTNRAVMESLERIPKSSSTEVWYEDLLADPNSTLACLSGFLGSEQTKRVDLKDVVPLSAKEDKDSAKQSDSGIAGLIQKYCDNHYQSMHYVGK